MPDDLCALVLEASYRSGDMIAAAGLNVLYLVLDLVLHPVHAYALFHHLLHGARHNGSLVRLGE